MVNTTGFEAQGDEGEKGFVSSSSSEFLLGEEERFDVVDGANDIQVSFCTVRVDGDESKTKQNKKKEVNQSSM